MLTRKKLFNAAVSLILVIGIVLVPFANLGVTAEENQSSNAVISRSPKDFQYQSVNTSHQIEHRGRTD